ncbi:hypothetical protein KIL84_015598 [Mauremys mutica]|uniref:Uncharacterized protein n=1 Tax=Mauremys mutica TaxID=74926 RepID=A0A9D4AS23_9SAUR|nr:hypothetical protein KIL84_015598 [Mauremys mutica]
MVRGITTTNRTSEQGLNCGQTHGWSTTPPAILAGQGTRSDQTPEQNIMKAVISLDHIQGKAMRTPTGATHRQALEKTTLTEVITDPPKYCSMREIQGTKILMAGT